MIVIDSSAIIAIVIGEPEAEAFMTALVEDRAIISAMTVFESETVVLGKKGPGAVPEVRDLLTFRRVEIIPFDDAQASAASEAYARFGKGVHKARLNLCDCAAYALAKSRDLPLLYKGDDFARADVASAVTRG